MSTLDDPATIHEIDDAWHGRDLPQELIDAWGVAREARLFADVSYGQWGLVLLSPSASAQRTAREPESRPSEYRPDDIVIGEFLGDQELLVLAASEAGVRRVLIALPLDSRAEWFGVADGLNRFLDRYFEHGGDKYWERDHCGMQPG